MTITPEQLKKWRSDAEESRKRCPGPWGFSSSQGCIRYVYNGTYENHKEVVQLPTDPKTNVGWVVGQHIVNSQPDNFIALIDSLNLAIEALEFYDNFFEAPNMARKALSEIRGEQ